MHPAPNSSPKTPENAAADDALAELRARAGKANINEKTLLATEYLNHFNEFVMVLDLIPDMPDCLEDAEAWQPKHYQDHFRDSAFSAKELAIMAYDHSPAEYRDQFKTLVDLINTLIPKGLERIRSAIDEGNVDRVGFECSNTSKSLQKLMDLVSAVINGENPTIDQRGIDAMLKT